MTKEQFDAAYASISKSYKEKIDLLQKARDSELGRLERHFVRGAQQELLPESRTVTQSRV